MGDQWGTRGGKGEPRARDSSNAARDREGTSQKDDEGTERPETRGPGPRCSLPTQEEGYARVTFASRGNRETTVVGVYCSRHALLRVRCWRCCGRRCFRCRCYVAHWRARLNQPWNCVTSSRKISTQDRRLPCESPESEIRLEYTWDVTRTWILNAKIRETGRANVSRLDTIRSSKLQLVSRCNDPSRE